MTLYLSSLFLTVFLQVTNTVDSLMADTVAGMTTLFPWWQVALVVALIVGLAIRIVPRVIKRMG